MKKQKWFFSGWDGKEGGCDQKSERCREKKKENGEREREKAFDFQKREIVRVKILNLNLALKFEKVGP